MGDDVAHEGLLVRKAPFARLGARTELHDDRAGLQGRPGAHRGADVVAAAAFDATRQLDALFGLQLLDGGEPERFLLFNVGDGGERPGGVGLPHRRGERLTVEVPVEGERDGGDEG